MCGGGGTCLRVCVCDNRRGPVHLFIVKKHIAKKSVDAVLLWLHKLVIFLCVSPSRRIDRTVHDRTMCVYTGIMNCIDIMYPTSTT